jgi:DNA-binding IclR family transcriptional regulator
MSSSKQKLPEESTSPRQQLEAAQAPRVVQSLERGLNLLAYVVEASEPVKLHEVVRRFGLDKASAYRLLTTLEQAGLVVKDPVEKTYTIGNRLLRWISAARNDKQLILIARPLLERLAHQTRESSHLGVLTGTRVTLIDVVPPDALVAIKHSVGNMVEAYCSAVGKALLAFLTAEAQERLIHEIEFRRFTGNTIVEPAKFRDELIRVKEAGYAVDDGEFNDWIFCIGAPILDYRGEAVASIGLSVFKPTLNEDPRRLAYLRAAVTDCATALSSELHQPDNKHVTVE